MQSTAKLACLMMALATSSCQTKPDAGGGPSVQSMGSTATQAVGAALAGAKRVSVAELLAKPAGFVGQTVRLEGEVTAMCHHQRAWFAIRDDATPASQYVRVQTRPAFLVPTGAIGKRAKAEGRVELVQVPQAMAQHYASDHGLGDPKAVTGPVQAPVIIAMGAEFD
ncbi:MAG: DUF4920 domain-containing protein [Polyangiaceae bacterium]|nr:DUF4920 domain-containing protein [Polyangiaceae bacterium]